MASDDYKERVSYDANGNILTYLRNGATAVNGLAMDSLTYQYGRNNSGQLINNRLRYVHDRVADNAYTEDIDSQTPLTLSQVQAEKLDAQTTDNYQYDEIGNLIKDTKEGITAIEWNVYGKIKSITKGSMTITYTYDAVGNRISKQVAPASGPTRKTYYVRDASGNVMSVYEEGSLVNDGNLTQAEVHLYGSSRLGIFKPDVDMTSLVATDVYGFERGKKFFELSNHLGNVLVTVTDRKNGVALSSSTALVDYYLPDVASANDYYPFGMTMPGRSSHSDKYRYGFNGKEKDDDLHSLTAYDYGFRIYNPALGRFLSVDPLMKNYPMLTSYQFAANIPIACIDLDGLENWWIIFSPPGGLAQPLLETSCGREIAESFYRNVKGTIDGFVDFFNAVKNARSKQATYERMVELGLAPATAGLTKGMAQDATQNMQNLASMPEQTLVAIFDHYSKMIKGVAEGDCGAIGDLTFELAMALVPFDEAPRLLKAGVKDFKLLDNIIVAKVDRAILGEIGEDARRVVDAIEGGTLPGSGGAFIGDSRLSNEAMQQFSDQYGVEFAQIYTAGPGKNGGGGFYTLYSGTEKTVNVPFGEDIFLINHTHPGGTVSPSIHDINYLKKAEAAGSPQKSSVILPKNKPPVKFNKNTPANGTE